MSTMNINKEEKNVSNSNIFDSSQVDSRIIKPIEVVPVDDYSAKIRSLYTTSYNHSLKDSTTSKTNGLDATTSKTNGLDANCDSNFYNPLLLTQSFQSLTPDTGEAPRDRQPLVVVQSIVDNNGQPLIIDIVRSKDEHESERYDPSSSITQQLINRVCTNFIFLF